MAWIGPVFYPYLYSDFFDYTFFPYAYDEGYWAYAYDDFIDGVFFAYGQPLCRRSAAAGRCWRQFCTGTGRRARYRRSLR